MYVLEKVSKKELIFFIKRNTKIINELQKKTNRLPIETLNRIIIHKSAVIEESKTIYVHTYRW